MTKLNQSELEFLQSKVENLAKQNEAGGIKVLSFSLHVNPSLHRHLGDKLQLGAYY